MLLFTHTPSVKIACRCGYIPFLICSNVMENLRKKPGTCLFLMYKLTCFLIVICNGERLPVVLAVLGKALKEYNSEK